MEDLENVETTLQEEENKIDESVENETLDNDNTETQEEIDSATKEVSFEEAPEYIQKGMDYDRIRRKYDETKPVSEFVENLAKKNNMTIPEYLEAVKQHEREIEINTLAEKNQISREMAEELHLLRQERKQREIEKQEFEKKEAQRKEYLQFVEEFPDINVETIPNEVFEIKQNNPRLSLSDAYIRHQYNVIKNQNSIEQHKQKNASASTGSVKNDGGDTVDILTEDKISKMSPREINSRWEEIKKFYKMK